MRIDKLLFCLRFARSRGAAQRWIAEGHIRCNGRRVLSNDREIAAGDVLVLPLKARVLPIEVLALPARRGPPAEARACYRELDAAGASAIAGDEIAQEEGPAQP